MNIYSNQLTNHFISISNLFHPRTIDSCFEHDGAGAVPGIKTDLNEWDFSGHRGRLIETDEATLQVYARLYDAPGTPPSAARLPTLHLSSFVKILERIAHSQTKLADLGNDVITTQCWDESNQQKDGTIKRSTTFVDCVDNLVYAGPHFHIGNPLSKTPRRVCTEKGHYDVLDLSNISEDYMPRTNYIPACPMQEYRRRMPDAWGETKVADHYRLIARKMISPEMERTLISCIIPPRIAHTNGAISIAFRSSNALLASAAQFFSLPFDFFIKSTGKSNLYNDTILALPFIHGQPFIDVVSSRVLMLNCLVENYRDLWNESFSNTFQKDLWTNADLFAALGNPFSNLTHQWSSHCALRTELARRQALIELDVLVSMIYKITLSELTDMYRIQFPVMRQYEGDTYYDQNGRIVFTANKSLPGVGVERKVWEDIKTMNSGMHVKTFEDDTTPGGPFKRTITYQAPFFSMNRERDYEVAWKEFSSRFGKHNAMLIHKDDKISSII